MPANQLTLFRIVLAPLFIVVVPLLVWAQAGDGNCRRRMEYVSRNQIEPQLIYLAKVAGRTIDPHNVPVPEVCVGLFTEKTHHLVAQVSVNREGKFRFDAIPNGRYRLVARVPEYDYFCPVNAGIYVRNRKARHNRGRAHLLLHMVLPALDVSSWAEVARP